MLIQVPVRFRILVIFSVLLMSFQYAQAEHFESPENAETNLSFLPTLNTSEVIISVRWRRWSSDNKVDVFDPSGNLLESICNPAHCYNALVNSFYTTSINLGCQIDGPGYYIVMYDYYGDGWNGGGSYVQVTSGGTTVINNSGAGTNQSGTTITFEVSGGGGNCGLIAGPAIDLDSDNDGIPDATECPDDYALILLEDFTTVPNTDLVPDGTCVDVAGENPVDAGTYILTDINNSPLIDNWLTPTGVVFAPTTIPTGIALPSGNFLLINAFGSNAGAFNQCHDITSDENGNGQGGEMVILDANGVVPGEYALSSFFAELTNTSPHIGSYSFVVKNAGTGAEIANIPATTLPQNGGNGSPWYHNVGEFTLTATTDLQIILLQTQGEDGGADLAIDNFALHRIGCWDTDGDGIANNLDLDSDNDGIPDIIEAGGVDANNDGQVDYAIPGDETTMVDTDGDGLADAYDNIDSGSGANEVTNGTPLVLINTDGTGNPNLIDIDSDDDGIVDNTEAQSTFNYIPPTGFDDDGDGLDNAYDTDCTGGCTNSDGVTTDVSGVAIIPVDTESDTEPDYVDTDSDNDNIADVIEGHDVNGNQIVDDLDNPIANTGTPGGTADVDADGLLDGFDNNLSNFDATNASMSPMVHPDFQSEITAEKDWRESYVDPCAVVPAPIVEFEKIENIGLDEIGDTWAMAWGDYDADGNVDLFVTNYSATEPNYLYKNNGDGTFVRITTGDIATDVASSLSATWGDYDNDGYLDLFVANNIGFENFLYRNNAGLGFTKILQDPAVRDKGYAHGSSWVDYDNDGFLDLFVTDLFQTKFNHLYHNNGDGTFTETNAEPTLEASPSVSAAWGDYDNDGLVDLFVANNQGANNSLYKNNGNGSFTKITSGAIVTDGGNSVGGSWGDYDNDGDLDLFVPNASNQDNFLYQNNGNGTFTKITSGNIVNDGGHSHGSSWADYDFDGDLDLIVSNDQGQNNFLYENNADGTFTSVVGEITSGLGESFGTAWADYDNDGDLDVFVVNHNSNENFLYRNNKGACGSTACISLFGTISNRSAIGSKVFVKANIDGNDVWQMREISSQTGGGIGSQNELKVNIGIGNAVNIDSIIVEWSSGYVQILTNQIPNDCLELKEDNASEVCGIAYYDEDGSCTQNGTELGIPNMMLTIQPGNRTVITDSEGKYSIALEPGVYTVEENTTGTDWTSTCTTQQTVNVTGIAGTYCGIDFANSAGCPYPDLTVDISATVHRVGFENLIALTYKNEGSQIATDVDLIVDFGPEVIPLESSVPWDFSSGTTKTWRVGDIPISTSVTIYVKDSVSVNATIGEMIDLTATITGLEDECDVTNNLATDSQPAVGAVDPNDILVNPEGYIDNDQELIYKIRFQNVGNATVSTVRLEDQLPENLDISTLQIGVASHSYKFDIFENNRLVWVFDNINMPDSLTNEPESHGFVTFKILPKKDLKDGTTIENSAEIFFDNVAPLKTNTVVNIIGDKIRPIAEAGNLQIYPNPVDEESTITIIPFDGSMVDIQAVYLHDLLGRKLLSREGVMEKSFQLNRGALTPGYYIVRAIGTDGKEYSGKIIIR